MKEKGKKIFYGIAIHADSDKETMARIYAPRRGEMHLVTSEDFDSNNISIYGYKVPIFPEYNIKKGDIVGALFREESDTLKTVVGECRVVEYTKEELETLDISAPPETETFTKVYEYEKEKSPEGENLNSDEEEKNEEEEEEAKEESEINEQIEEKEPFDEDVIEIEKKYTYESMVYTSPYMEIITADFDDESEVLEISLRTESPNLLAGCIAEALGIARENVKVTNSLYSSMFNEHFLSTLRSAIICAKAAEKTGLTIKYLYRPTAISPSLTVVRNTKLSKDGSRIYSEDVTVYGDLGNCFMLQEEVADTIAASILPHYSPDKLNITIHLLKTNKNCTLLFAGYIKAATSSSALEHVYNIAYAIKDEPILFIERHMGCNAEEAKKIYRGFDTSDLKENYQRLLKEEDAYVQSAVFSLSEAKDNIFLSPISSLNKAQAVALTYNSNGISEFFEKKNEFSLVASRDEEDNEIKVYLGSNISSEHLDRLEDYIKTLNERKEKNSLNFIHRAGTKEMYSNIGPDISYRYTSVLADKISHITGSKDVKKEMTRISLVNKEDSFLVYNFFWGMATLSGYKDFVTNELIIDDIHVVLKHSKSFDSKDDMVCYRRKILQILAQLKVKLSKNFDDDDNFKIELIDCDKVFDAEEGIFSVILSGVRLLDLLLSPVKKQERTGTLASLTNKAAQNTTSPATPQTTIEEEQIKEERNNED